MSEQLSRAVKCHNRRKPMLEALYQKTCLPKSSGNFLDMNFEYLNVSVAQELTEIYYFGLSSCNHLLCPLSSNQMLSPLIPQIWQLLCLTDFPSISLDSHSLMLVNWTFWVLVSWLFGNSWLTLEVLNLGSTLWVLYRSLWRYSGSFWTTLWSLVVTLVLLCGSLCVSSEFFFYF